MLKHNKAAALAAALALTLALAACGGTPAETIAETEATATAAATEVTLVTEDTNQGLAYVGSYDDTWSMRAHLEIIANGDGGFTVQMMHGDSADVSYEWMGEAVFDTAKHAFVCAQMTEYRLTATEDDVRTEEVAHYTDVILPVAEDGAISVPKLNTNYHFTLPTTEN